MLAWTIKDDPGPFSPLPEARSAALLDQKPYSEIPSLLRTMTRMTPPPGPVLLFTAVFAHALRDVGHHACYTSP